jgi:very-short-patch-repair endonuclease
LQRLQHPIFSRRLRRISFIPTTGHKFVNAVEINELYSGKHLEDRLWAELKRRGIEAERQAFVYVKRKPYELDFAIYCANGQINVETDGDRWHTNPKRAAKDNLRNNALETEGWRILRFNTHQIQEEMAAYCVPTILENISKLGGINADTSYPLFCIDSKKRRQSND